MPSVYAIDLPTALRLADAQNPQIQFARERIRAAQAEFELANVLWVPSLNAGPFYNRHDGQLQDIRGRVITVSRSSLYAYGGASARFDLADAVFQPLAARQLVATTMASERVATNDVLLAVALDYWELVRARAGVVIAEESLRNAKQLDDRTQSYLRANAIKEADAARARAETGIRQQQLEIAQQFTQTSSIRLGRRLRLDVFVALQPLEPQVVPVTLVACEAEPRQLADIALTNRPELAESQALVGLAVERLRQAKWGPLLPSVLLDYRAGGFGGGMNGFFGDFNGRHDFDANIFWELRSLGIGDRAFQRQRASELRQAQWREIDQMDRVVAETADALARLRSALGQMSAAKAAVEAADRSHALNWKLFTDGGIELIRPIEVLQSIQALDRARLGYLDAVIDYNRAQFLLYWALGYPVNSTSQPSLAPSPHSH
jgi:outer membrane protein TolC